MIYSKAVNALAVRALERSWAVLVCSATLLALSSLFIPGEAIKHTAMPKIAPPVNDAYNGICNAYEFIPPAAKPITNPIPRGFSASFTKVALPLITSVRGFAIRQKLQRR